MCFIVCKGLLVLSNDDVGVAGGTVYQEIWPGAAFQTGDFVEKKLGGLPTDYDLDHIYITYE